MTQASLILRRLRAWTPTGTSAPMDLAVVDGKFAAVTPGMKAEREIDAEGRIAVPGLIEPHIHLDKALILESVRPNVSGTLPEAIEIIWERKRSYTVEEIAARAARVMATAVDVQVVRPDRRVS